MSSRVARMVISNFHVNPSHHSPNETEILQLVAEGKTPKFRKSCSSQKKRPKRISEIFIQKLQVNRKSEAIAKANLERLI